MSKHFKAYVTTFSDPDQIDDCTEAYGEWPDIQEPCDASPTGQCEYDALRNPERCKHCGRVT